MKTLILATACCVALAGPSFSQPPQTQDLAAKADPYDVAATAIRDLVMKRYAGEKYSHRIEDLLTALGADAGYGCQMGIREGFIKLGIVQEKRAFVILGAKDGRKYYFGELLNGCLMNRSKAKQGASITVWSLIAGAAQHAGADRYPDVEEIQRFTAQSAGLSSFGIPRLPKEHAPDELPIDALRATWPHIQKLLIAHAVDPRFWGWVCATAAQRVILQNKKSLDPSMAAKIFMESALPMSRIDGPGAGLP